MASEPFNIPATFNAVDDAIDVNADISDAILASTLEMYGLDPTDDSPWRDAASPNDMDKARSTIRQFFRDWTPDAAAERAASYGPMLSALDTAFAHIPASRRAGVKVLTPGAGLGRLTFEVCKAGYTVEGNEISYHMLMAGNWILNHVRSVAAHDFYPWALHFSNRISRKHQLLKTSIPDVCPAEEIMAANNRLDPEFAAEPRMSMTAGDFCVTYKSPERRDEFDAILTCFFIDTAPNLIAYIEAIRNCLKDGGVWINLGPLLWHFGGGQSAHQPCKADQGGKANEGIGEAGSFELSDEEVLELVKKFGFEITHHELLQTGAGYIQDQNSMLLNTYRPSFWVAKKQNTS